MSEKVEEILSNPEIANYKKEGLRESLEEKEELESKKSKKLIQLKAKMDELDGYINLVEKGVDAMDSLIGCTETISGIGSRLREIKSEIDRQEEDIDVMVESIEEEE